jgi:hypothetical protein
VHAGLEAESLETFHQADAAAQLLGIDAWPHHLRRVEANPRNSPSWFRLVQTEDPARFAHALQLARTLLPLDEIASGPAQEAGLGTEFDAHDTLLVVVQSLVDQPGQPGAERPEHCDDGLDLIEVALQSPVTRVRRGALQVLAAWADPTSESAVASLLERTLAREVDAELVADIEKLLTRAG